MDNSSKGGTVGGMGFAGVLTIVFIVLKLCHVINWSWVWVLSPLWIGWALMLIAALVIFIFMRKRW